MADIALKFAPEFRGKIGNGEKVCTCRHEAHGEPGDRFAAWGSVYEITSVLPLPLGLAAVLLYVPEGFASPADFRHWWAAHYGEDALGADSGWRVYCHWWRKYCPEASR